MSSGTGQVRDSHRRGTDTGDVRGLTRADLLLAPIPLGVASLLGLGAILESVSSTRRCTSGDRPPPTGCHPACDVDRCSPPDGDEHVHSRVAHGSTHRHPGGLKGRGRLREARRSKHWTERTE